VKQVRDEDGGQPAPGGEERDLAVAHPFQTNSIGSVIYAAADVAASPTGHSGDGCSIVSASGGGAGSSVEVELAPNGFGALQAAREEALTEFTAGPHATRWFTDNVAVAFPVERVGDAAVAVSLAELMAARLQTALAIRGYYWSGVIALGDAYLEPKFVFGPAVGEAV
jgi:hypothetical protein